MVGKKSKNFETESKIKYIRRFKSVNIISRNQCLKLHKNYTSKKYNRKIENFVQNYISNRN